MKDNRSEKNHNGGYDYILTTREADSKNTNWFCPTHRTSARSRLLENPPHCPFCGKEMINLGHRTRLPKKSASNWVWKNFLKLFQNRIKS